MNYVWMIIIGFVAGLVARFLAPGPNNPAGFILTTILGIVGAFVATWIGQAVGWYGPQQGAGLIASVVGAVVGEFVGSNSGIGYVMQRSIGTFDLPTMFAALVILALLGVILFWIVDRIERLVLPWHVSQREEIIFAS